VQAAARIFIANNFVTSGSQQASCMRGRLGTLIFSCPHDSSRCYGRVRCILSTHAGRARPVVCVCCRMCVRHVPRRCSVILIRWAAALKAAASRAGVRIAVPAPSPCGWAHCVTSSCLQLYSLACGFAVTFFVYDIINILLTTCVSRAEPGDAAWRAECPIALRFCDNIVASWDRVVFGLHAGPGVVGTEIHPSASPPLSSLFMCSIAVLRCVCRGSRVLRIYTQNVVDISNFVTVALSLECMLAGRTSFE
jgi:hypothetical protein